MDQLFTFFFKYRPAAFARGTLGFEPPGPWWLAALVGAAALALGATFYLRSARLATRDRLVLAGLRAGALAVLVVCLSGPVLLVATAVPQRNVVAVLIDDSRSMGIRDAADRSRLEAALEAFAPGTGRLDQRLGERFQVRTFRFSEALASLPQGALAPSGRQTDVAGALGAARERLEGGAPLAGVVVVSDGGDNADGGLTDELLRYRAAGVPVHTVGVGAERFDRDVAVEPADVPDRALRHSRLVLEVRLRHRGFGGATVPVIVEDEGAIVGRTDIRLPRSGDAVTASIGFTVETAGPRHLRIHVPVQRDEQVTENNAREALLVVEDRVEPILYFEGEPRFEVKFLRRALTDERQLRVATLQRTADDKFLRLDVLDSTELVAGFPRTRQELFRYRGLVLGSVEASFFTRDQLRMLADFVRVRGGGLLVLGGRHAYTAGGYAGTALADALPVLLPREADTAYFREVHPRPTPAGRRHPVTRLGGSDEEDAARWDSLPALGMAHQIDGTKPGAAVLLTGETPRGESLVMLAAHRYGRGRTVAFPVLDSWIWQMHASIPVTDQTHERLWRQLLRWLVSDVPEPVTVRPSAALVLPGRGVPLVADVTDSAYVALNGAEVVATVRAPDGTTTTQPLSWAVERDGEYRGTITPPAEGLYEVIVDARVQGRLVGTSRAYVQAGDPRLEFANAERRTALLERLADETGGRVYDIAAADGLPDDVRFTAAGATSRERLDLWDMPAVLLALLTLIGAEWGYRRVRGLA